ncbi:hypothetical protein K435DRAFT_447122 [Dendrothele bispora CBS 962.96]|uniref:Uncharacterized protein n=1 Tax=Dendrothele bispora (strain CBS 962.96) TaxID=1314807 RepID=A0A4S8MEJ9_DENBC|nr:hypothetical protein K435DRAFT_447122 [Dendrothele bispora CBS 962.96]
MTANATFILDSQDLQPVRVDIGTQINRTTGEKLDPPDIFRSTGDDGVFYQGSLLIFNGTNETEYIIEFDGSSISLFGYALGEVSKNFVVDQAFLEPNNLSESQIHPPLAGGQFPSSPFQGRIKAVQQMSIDYALVTATNTSNLEDTTIFVDDDDVEITWSGWTRQADHSYEITGVGYQPETPTNESGIIGGRLILVLPNGNSMHQSNTQDDSFVFRFAGEPL